MCNLCVCIYNKILAGILTFDFTRDLVGLCLRKFLIAIIKKYLMVLKVNNVWSLCLKKVIPNICARFPHDKITGLPTVLPEL